MSNDLTGDFDVVVEFPVPTATRVLAAMHRGRRFPHSLSIRVDDVPRRSLVGEKARTISARVDRFGDAIADRQRIGAARPASPKPFSVDAPMWVAVDAVVNGGRPAHEYAALVHSDLQGVAQLQLSAPTMSVPDESETGIAVHMQTMARYFPDPGTRDMPQFVRGEIRIGTRVDQVASQVGDIVDIDIRADSVDVAFTPAWSDRPLSAGDVKAIVQAIRNALKTGFQPSNAVLPPAVRRMQFKTYKTPPGGADAIAVLINTEDRGGDRSSAANVFLRGGDDFAFAAGKEFVVGTFDRTIGEALDQLKLREFNYSFDIVTRIAGYVISRITITYAVTLGAVRVELQSGQMLLTIEGQARTRSVLPNFGFRATQALTLQLSGAEAELASQGDISLVVTTGGIQGWLVNLFKGNAAGALRSMRDQAIGRAQPAVRRMLSANASVGAFLTSLMNPVNQSGAGPQEHIAPELAYTAFDITPSGLVLHGSLAVPNWPPAQVALDAVAGTGSAAHDYTALLSWIPGGTIREYLWRFSGQSQAFRIDSNTFVALDPPDAPRASFLTLVYGYVPICVTVNGERCSPSGPVVMNAVSATTCGWSAIPIFHRTRIPLDGARPLVALARPGMRGRIEVAGHAAPLVDEAQRGATNLIVYFGGDDASGALERLMDDVRRSERKDAAATVLAVLTPDQLAHANYVEGVVYAEDRGDGAWSGAFGVDVRRRPATLVIGLQGNVAWQREGALRSGELGAALREHLQPCGQSMPRLLRAGLRAGHAPPNILFPYAPGRDLTLRKLMGRPAILVFWHSALEPSVEMLRELRAFCESADGKESVLIAIHDGEATESVRRSTAPAIVVVDADRAIALAYGVTGWPTTVFIDEAGIVRDVRLGRFAANGKESQP